MLVSSRIDSFSMWFQCFSDKYSLPRDPFPTDIPTPLSLPSKAFSTMKSHLE